MLQGAPRPPFIFNQTQVPAVPARVDAGGVLCKVLIFTKATATGPQAPITGAGFHPKGVILVCGGATASGAFQAANDGGVGIGFLDGGTGLSGTESSDDNVATSNTGGSAAAKALRIVNGSGTVTAEVSSYTLDDDGFSLVWGTNDGVARIIYAFCFGGTDIQEVRGLDFSLTGTGSLHTQKLNFGFAPDVVFFLRASDNTALPQAYAGSFLALGAMTRAGEQMYLEPFSVDASSPSNALRSMLDERVSTNPNVGGGTTSFSSMDADGCTVSISSAWTTVRVMTFAVKGGQWKLGTSAKPTGAAPATHTITSGFRPRGGLLVTVNKTSLIDGFAANSEVSVGMMSATTERAAVVRVDKHSANPTFAKRYQDSAKALVKVDNFASTVDAAADVASFDDGGVTLTWNPNDAVASILGYVLVGDSAVPPRRGMGVVRSSRTNRARLQRGAWRRRAA